KPPPHQPEGHSQEENLRAEQQEINLHVDANPRKSERTKDLGIGVITLFLRRVAQSLFCSVEARITPQMFLKKHRIHYVTGVSRLFSARWHMFIFRQPSQGHILRCIHTGLIFNCHS
ncbi:hypothetical protein, partial [Bifidobacterium breve]